MDNDDEDACGGGGGLGGPSREREADDESANGECVTLRMGDSSAETASTYNMDIQEEIFETVRGLVEPLVRQYDPDVGDVLPAIGLSKNLSMADLSSNFASVTSRRKINPAEYTTALAAKINERLAAMTAEGAKSLLTRVESVGPYLNFFLDRPSVFKMTLKRVAEMKDAFGTTDVMKGKRVIVEHTSSNPNAPLHIGNLRNVMIGAHLARLLAAVGYDVKQHFYVNDLGAQIGLTALAYTRCYKMIKPTMKIDQWIGAMYAIMNTLSEMQKNKITLPEIVGAVGQDDCSAGLRSLQEKALARVKGEDKLEKGVVEYIDIFSDLYDRHKELLDTMLEACKGIDNIKEEAGKLNLAYERQEPWAIEIFRKMVIDCLTGVQQTLSTYGVQHDAFDFESELGWEGSNKKVLDIMCNSDYFVKPTQCNDKGVPEGGYLNMREFIVDMGLPLGKKGYPKDYPPLYVLRPDMSTLYTFRDIVYSFKKAASADLVLNIICTEQNLAQEKVALSMMMLNPEMQGRQYHVNYELVKLTTGKMSGRRGRYLLADDLYEDLSSVIEEKMVSRWNGIGKPDSETMTRTMHEVSTAAMKYALLASSCKTLISFDIKKITDFDDASAPFILYNVARLFSVQRKFEESVSTGRMAPLPNLDDIDTALLDDDREWRMLMEYVVGFPALIKTAACPKLPMPPQLPEYGTHKICDFLNSFTRDISSYYGPSGVRIMPPKDADAEKIACLTPSTHARLHLCAAFRQVAKNGLHLMMVNPLEKM